MAQTQYAGIDYGLGQSNINRETGIRFGVIPSREVGQSWYDSAEADYGSPHCPKCGNEADEPAAFGESFADGRPDDYTSEPYECDDYVCVDCQHFFGSESAFSDDPLGHYFTDAEYELSEGSDGDIFVTRSQYYSRSQFLLALCTWCGLSAQRMRGRAQNLLLRP